MKLSERDLIPSIEKASDLDKLLENAGSSMVMVEFIADWSEPCKMFKPILERAVAERKSQLQLFTIDSEEHPDIVAKYGVVSIPHILFFHKGSLLKRQVGFLPEKQFGTSSDGTPNIKELINHPKQPRKDIVLKTCYRNPPNILATAHALGFGINRVGASSDRFIQFFDEPSFWNDIGYKTVSGELGFGKDVVIERDKDFVPSFFEERLDMKNNLITKSFPGLKEQYEYLAQQIKKNITEDELLPTDILIINGNPMTTKNDLLPLKNYLAKIGIDSHLAGVTSSVDEFFIDGKITLSGIYRAKGNEAPMVYIVNSEYCYEGIDISTRRNILFTAMTRTKAWAQVLGCGRSMDSLIGEIDTLRKNDFKLKFKYPTKEELKKLRKIHKDLNQSEKDAYTQIENLKNQIKNGNIDPNVFKNLDAETKTILKSIIADD